MEIYDEEELTAIELERQKNIIANYEFMKSCGLPVKPLVYVKRTKLKFGEESYDYVSEESTESESEEWGSKPKKKQPKIVPNFTRKVKNPRKFMEDKKKQEERNSKKAKKTKKPVDNPSTSTCTITSQTRSQQKQQTTSQTTNQQQTTTSRATSTTTTKVQPLKKKRVRSPVVETRESRYPKRDGMRKDYREEEVPDDDHYLFCEACGEFFYGDCPTHGPLFPHADKETSGSKESLPEGLEIKESTIPSAGLGVFATQSFDVGVRFGPYVGKKICPYVPKDEVDTSYMWEIMKEGRVVYFIDGKEERFGNWMRYINCSRTEGEQNLVAFQYHGEIYYRVYKPIIKDTELLVWYGEEYAQDLGMSTQDDPNTDQLQTYTDERFPCKFCDICFSDEKYLMPHAKRCTKRFIKPCDNSLTKPLLNHKGIDFKRHMRTHTGEKPYKCTRCDAAFAQNVHLKIHMRTHTGEKPYKCTRCDAAFAQNVNLKIHMRTHTGEKPYKCTRCDAAFAHVFGLKTHMRTHTGEKPYKCTRCDAAFAQIAHLKIHMRTHTGEKPYKCTQCYAAFSRADNLKTHMRTHTGEKP